MDKVLNFMIGLAKKAGDFARDLQNGDQSHVIQAKATAKDIVTAADKMTEKLILDAVREEYPDYSILAEESGKATNPDSEFLWVIDPIDGTTNYAAGVPFYSVSIGLYKSNKPYAGVVYMPALGEMFYGKQGEGAYLNGKRLEVTRNTDLINSIGATGFACLRANLKKDNMPAFCDIAPRLRGIRRTGSAALDTCFVAAGRYDFFWEYPLSLYDIGAGAILVLEAGGKITDFDGGSEYPQKGIIVSNGLLHETVRDLVLKHDFR